MIELNVLSENTIGLDVNDSSQIPLDVMTGGSGGITPSGTKSISITANGTYTEDVTVYANAEIDVNVSGGITPSGTKNISITANGTTTEDVTNYANAQITANVPNTYTVADEGKVVDDGALVSQTSKSITANGTHDTTTNNSVTVAVANSYTSADEGKVVSNGALVSQTSDTVTANDTYDTTLINSLTVNVSGGGGNIGGLANMVDVTNLEYTVGYMLSQMKNGNTVGGTITYSSAFANTEQLILSTGLTEIHGFMFVCPTYDITTQVGSGQSNKFYLWWRHSYESEPNHFFAVGLQQLGTTAGVSVNGALGTNYQSSPNNGTIRIDGGNIYYTARYNANANYQIVRPWIEYEWLAW